MIVKSPACYDGSHYWSSVPDFKLIDPRPAVLIFKATEAYPGAPFSNTTDPKFIDYFSRSMEIGCIRGAYHFFRKNYDATRQANHFLSVMSKVDVLSTDMLILDIEEGGEKASQLWAWFEAVRREYPNNLPLIYSRKNILDAIVMTYSEKEYFKKIATWTAGYPYFPDLYSSVPNSKIYSYVPDQSKYGPVYFWQYSEVGIIKGINGSVDLNWINPTYLPLLGTNSIGEVSMANFSAKCTTQAKVWSDVGGANLNHDIKVGETVYGDSEKSVSGVVYLHLNSPISGWTKKQWFSVTYTPDPDPDPTPIPTEKKIVKSTVTFDDGTTEDLYPQ